MFLSYHSDHRDTETLVLQDYTAWIKAEPDMSGIPTLLSIIDFSGVWPHSLLMTWHESHYYETPSLAKALFCKRQRAPPRRMPHPEWASEEPLT